jgi:hypothetical protein
MTTETILKSLGKHEAQKLLELMRAKYKKDFGKFKIVKDSLIHTVDVRIFAHSAMIRIYADGVLDTLKSIKYEIMAKMSEYSTKGHDCELSPDGYCHYISEPDPTNKKFRIIELDNGKQYRLPANHDPGQETVDSCIFCGEPDERK